MKQIEKDMIIINALFYLFRNENDNDIKRIIPDFDAEGIRMLAKRLECYKSDKKLEEAIIELANETYKRLKKKIK
ncbi:hypothetical protein [Paenibacillus oleatilyticus]|uniref:hypothetical protein n=1 Tax=Paenibacillus oleatilyticus TaxID=2594886 RepID=UPI001C1F9FBB|nr:hypothetical protein [Paenibacillus oleatilyticus]MBU7315982.1 hypothetical protein [Paenibacillus oleatilyticus]